MTIKKRKKFKPKNPYGRPLTTKEASNEITSRTNYDVSEYKLRTWRMEDRHPNHPLPFHKKDERPQSHCRYKWDEIMMFIDAINTEKYLP